MAYSCIIFELPCDLPTLPTIPAVSSFKRPVLRVITCFQVHAPVMMQYSPDLKDSAGVLRGFVTFSFKLLSVVYIINLVVISKESLEFNANGFSLFHFDEEGWSGG